ncbi:MAG TPA: hypothetical protein VF796_10335 [Humisphaera sp.]
MKSPVVSVVLVVGVVAAVMLLAWYRRTRPTTGPSSESVDPTQLVPGPIRHDALSQEQLDRIARLQETFAEVDPSPMDVWIDNFKRDRDPDRELRVWEQMARAYSAFTSSRPLTLAEKKEAFGIVLARSGAPTDQVLPGLRLKHISRSDAAEIMRHFESVDPITLSPRP